MKFLGSLLKSRFPAYGSAQILLVALLFVVSFDAQAQTDLATIRGVVVDQSGAAVPNARITLTHQGTNISRESQSGENGNFEIPYLTQGTYRLEASASGFKNYIASDILLSARETRRIDVRFELGAVGSEITVNAGAAAIATEGSQIAGGFNREAFVSSPLSQSFFPQAYMTTLPNIQTPQGGWNLQFAGQPSAQTAQNMDGVTNDGALNLVQNMQDFDDLQVVAVNNSAEFSRVAQFSMVSKGGANDFHGRVYYDMVNSALNARSFFDPRKIPYKEHRGGANFSGPIIRNKLFFYGGYSLQRIPSESYYLRDVPTDAYRRGDFSALLSQSTPVVIKDPLNGNTPFAGNVIPTNRFSSVSLKTQDQFIPQPNRGTSNSTFQNYGFLHPFPVDLYKWDSVTTRIDYNLSSKNQLYGRFINRLTPYVLNGPFANLGTWTRSRNHHSIVISDTHSFSPGLINQFHWGWIRDYFIDGDTVAGVTPQKGDEAVAAIGLQGVNRGNYSVMGFPKMDILGLTTLSQQAGGVNLNRNDQEFTDSVTWAVSNHVIKFGGELRYFHDFKDSIVEGNYGSFAFNGSLTGFGYADFLLGLPYSSSRLDPLTKRTQTAYELGMFITDTYKVTRKLTLDLGLRWDYFRHAIYQDGMQYNWDPATGNIVVPQGMLSKVSPLYPKTINVVEGNVYPTPRKTNFRPRIGFAYRLRDDLVIRGGYGIYSETLGNLYRALGGGPYQIAETYFNQVVNGQPLLSFPNPFPQGISGAVIPSQSTEGYPLDTNNGAIHQFNLSVEKELGRSLGVRFSYIGSRSRGLNYRLESVNKPEPSLIPFTAARRPYPQFVNAWYWLNDGAANYDAGQVEIQKKAGSLILTAHYTLSNSMMNYANLENPYNHSMWNRDQYNSRHRAVLNTTYDLPFGKGRRYMSGASRLVDGFIGGWQMGWVMYLQSGQYFRPTYSGSDPSNTNTFSGVADRIADGNLPRDQRDPNRWFDVSAFAVPKAGSFGNGGYAILEGPGLNLNHLSLIKSLAITERFRFVAQGMMTNVFNHSHFDWPNANISVPSNVSQVYRLREATGGREMSGPRNIQLRFRIEF